MAKIELTELTIKSITVTLSMSEAKDLENIIYNKVEDYNLYDSERVTIRGLREQLSEVLESEEN